MLSLSAGEVGQLYRFVFTHVHGITHSTSRRNIEGLLWVGRGHYSKILLCLCTVYLYSTASLYDCNHNVQTSLTPRKILPLKQKKFLAVLVLPV